jgi:DNA-binding CsgD family transcriptional regulator/N-acetylneuraminic acid mutarotase
MEIVRLLATGATNQQIAQDLIISVNTVKVHLRNIYTKLEVASRTEATMVAVRRGWVAVPLQADRADKGKDASATLPSPALPRLERWPRVSMVKRAILVMTTLLALVALFLPQVLQSQANGEMTDPIEGVFPTAPSGASATRWHTRAQMPTPRTNLAVVSHKNLIFAIGGVSNDGVTGKVEVYDPESDMWTTRSPKPTAVGFVSAAVVEDKIYVPGGLDAEQTHNVLEIYDPIQDVWTTGAPTPKALAAYGLAVFGEHIYLFGGRGRQEYVAMVYRYDPAADHWESLQPMDKARGFVGAAALGEYIYVIGGYDGINEFNDCEAYNPVTDTWIPRSPMTVSRGGLAIVTVRDSLFAIGGGMTNYLAFNERYDPRTDRWNRIETPVAEQWRGLGAAFISPHIYAIGGWNGANLSVNEAYQARYQILVP